MRNFVHGEKFKVLRGILVTKEQSVADFDGAKNFLGFNHGSVLHALLDELLGRRLLLLWRFLVRITWFLLGLSSGLVNVYRATYFVKGVRWSIHLLLRLRRRLV